MVRMTIKYHDKHTHGLVLRGIKGTIIFVLL